ncbi:MAG: hypothetical protein FJ279_34480 [Planctomycetes bacterium]|nr:hypothetical protein [Planctomycetota bacterium]
MSGQGNVVGREDGAEQGKGSGERVQGIIMQPQGIIKQVQGKAGRRQGGGRWPQGGDALQRPGRTAAFRRMGHVAARM